MSEPFIELFYETRAANDFAAMERCARQAKLTLENPVTREVVRFSDWGEDIVSSRQEIVARARANDNISFKLWRDADTYAFARLRRLTGVHAAERIYPYLLEADDDLPLAQAFMDRFRSMQGDRMLVIDLPGDSAEFVNWAEFFLDSAMPLPLELPTPFSPTLIGMDARRFARDAESFADFHVERIGEMVLVSRPACLSDYQKWITAVFDQYYTSVPLTE